MKCPVCRDVVLVDHELEEDLPSLRCHQCGGVWVQGDRYHLWVERQGPDKGRGDGGEEEEEVELPDRKSNETNVAKLCPRCGRILGRFGVGHGLNFSLDRCGHCGGIWFDQNEWELLKFRGLHEKVHYVFTAAWQAEILRDRHQRQTEMLLVAKLGEEDLAEIRRIKAWIEFHPHREELYAYLIHDSE